METKREFRKWSARTEEQSWDPAVMVGCTKTEGSPLDTVTLEAYGN